jgi:hypothetical protein
MKAYAIVHKGTNEIMESGRAGNERLVIHKSRDQARPQKGWKVERVNITFEKPPKIKDTY